MAYPQDGSIKTELLINGVWTDISTRVRGESRVVISRGRANEQGRVSSQRAEFTLNNRDGLFSNGNPLSPYYRLLPRNTQVRITAGSGDTYLKYPQDNAEYLANRASTPDSANLDITGDIEIRVDFRPYSRRPYHGMMLISKYQFTTNNRSWAVYLDAKGCPVFTWSVDGTNATRISTTSTVPIPLGTERLALKVTLDVVNGANKTVQFSTASEIDGTYTVLDTITTAGNTSIYASLANVCIGQGDEVAAPFGASAAIFRGQFYKARIYNGIAGTVRANPDFTVQTIETTSFADSAGATWTIGGTTRISSNRLRFWGEMSALPQAWDTTGTDVWVTVTASGMIARLTQGAKPLSSPLYRALSLKTGLTGYWPLEDGSQASSSAFSAVSGVRPANTIKVQYADSLTLPGAKQAPSFIDASGRFIGPPKSEQVYTGTSYFSMYFYLPSLPATAATFIKLSTSGNARTISIAMDSGGFIFNFIGADGAIVSTGSVTFGPAEFFPNGRWLAFNLIQTASGGNVSWAARWSNVAGETFVASAPIVYAGTVGRITNVEVSAASSSAYVDASFAHILTANVDLDFVSTDLARAANAFIGETAAARAVRLAKEESVALDVVGIAANTEPMGYQGVDTFIELMYECQDAGLGILSESRDSLSLAFRTREDLEHKNNATITYGSKHLSEVPEVVVDDQNLTNDVTVTTPSGSSGRREITTGFTSVQAPPNGVGRYATEPTLNASDAMHLPDIASWMARIGSWDEARYPTIKVGLHRSAVIPIAPTLAALELGDTITLAGLPAWLPPDNVLLLAQGYSEVMNKFTWDITFNTTPAGQYNIGRYDYETNAGLSRYDHLSASLNASLTNTATTIVSIANSTTPVTLDLWTSTVGSYPFDVIINGERITFTQAPVTVGQIQTFSNCVRSVNGIVKTHGAGEPIRLFRPVFYQL